MQVNDKSPDFSTTDENGKEVASKDFRGQTVVLYFYPKADTPGCTKEACGFRDTYKEIKKTGVVLLGLFPGWPMRRRRSRICLAWSKKGKCTARKCKASRGRLSSSTPTAK